MTPVVDPDRLSQVARVMHAAADMVDYACQVRKVFEPPDVDLSDLGSYRSIGGFGDGEVDDGYEQAA